MKSAVAKVKAALAQRGVVQHFTGLLVRGGLIHASDGRMTVAAPFDYPGEFLVPGEEFEALISRLPDNAKLDLDGDTLKVRAGRMRGAIKTLPINAVSYPTPPDNWRKPPEQFLHALKLARPFVSDNAIHYWSLCVALCEAKILASANVTLVEVDCPELDGKGILFPCWAVDYLLSRSEPLIGMQVLGGEGNEAIAFKWADQSWMRTQVVKGAFPEVAHTLLGTFVQPEWELGTDWKEAYRAVSELTDGAIELYTDRIVGAKGQGKTEHDANTPCPENAECSRYDPKFLNPVVAIATHWHPQSWPNPAFFAGPGIRGLIAGRN